MMGMSIRRRAEVNAVLLKVQDGGHPTMPGNPGVAAAFGDVSAPRLKGQTTRNRKDGGKLKEGACKT